MSEEEEFDEGGEEEVDDPQEVARAETELRIRCAATGSELKDDETLWGDKVILVSLPNGRDKRELSLVGLVYCLINSWHYIDHL